LQKFERLPFVYYWFSENRLFCFYPEKFILCPPPAGKFLDLDAGYVQQSLSLHILTGNKRDEYSFRQGKKNRIGMDKIQF